MLKCGDTLFIHAPKVGGMSATAWLLNNLDGNFHLFIPETAHDHARAMLKFDDINDRLFLVPGSRHEPIPRAINSLQNWKLKMPRRMFSIVRPAEDLVSSYFHYIRRPEIAERLTLRGVAQQDVSNARNNDLQEFARTCRIFGKGPVRMMNYYQMKRADIELDVIPLELARDYLEFRFGNHQNCGRFQLERRNISKRSQVFDAKALTTIRRRFSKLDESYEKALNIWTKRLA